MTPHTSSHATRRVRATFLFTLLSFVCVSTARTSLWSDNRQAIIGGAVGAVSAVCAYLLAKNAVQHECYRREQQQRQIDDVLDSLRASVHRLKKSYDALPITQFEKEADRKISEVRQFLSSDLHQYRETLAQKMHQLNAELGRLQSERAAMLQVLEQQRAHFDHAAAFIRSVHDSGGASYLNDVVIAKQEVERLIAQLHQQQHQLTLQLSTLSDIAASNQATLNRQKHNLQDTETTIRNLNNTVVQRRSEVDTAARASQDAVSEAERIRTTVQKTQQETRAMKGELDVAVTALNQYLRQVQGDYQMIDQQVRSAKNQLVDVSTRMASLQDAVRHQGNTITNTSAQMHPQNSLPQTSQNSTPKNDSAVVKAAVQLLQRALSRFSTATRMGENDYHSAFSQFAKRNHPNYGGDANVFGAVDGLYQALSKQRLLQRTPSYIPAEVRRDVLMRTRELESVINNIKH